MKHHFFWQNSSPFSQWHPSTYVLDNKTYSCAEQGMMEAKALLFGAPDTAKQIMACKSNQQAKMKKLGRNGVPKFNQTIWEKHRLEIVTRHNIAKFQQNPGLLKTLLGTKDLILVEASPYDRIWGIGYRASDALANQSHWGLNLLGQALMKVRDELRDRD